MERIKQDTQFKKLQKIVVFDKDLKPSYYEFLCIHPYDNQWVCVLKKNRLEVFVFRFDDLLRLPSFVNYTPKSVREYKEKMKIDK